MQPTFSAGILLAACLLQCSLPAFAADTEKGASVAQVHNSGEVYQEDQKIMNRATELIYAQYKVLIHVNVTSFNRNVLISGEVPDETARSAIGTIVSGIEGVLHVDNELVIAPNSSLASRSNDSLISTNVKLRLARDKRTNIDRIRVVTESGTVFLMGKTSRAEASAAAEIASTSSRVKRVVKLFEYTD